MPFGHRIGKDRKLLQIEEVEQAAAFLIHQSLAADGDGRHFATARRQAIAHQLIIRILARSRYEPALKAEFPDGKRFIFPRAAAHQRDDFDSVPRAKQPAGMSRQYNYY